MSTLDSVAHHLQLEAIQRREKPLEFDVFGRSAYNRYYYATFLLVKKMASGLDARWSRLPHKDYPEILNGEIKKKIARGRTRARKAGDSALVIQCHQASLAASQLADLMKAGSAVRVVADYFPEIPIQIAGSERFQLNSIDITTAHEWPTRASAFIHTIEQVWSQIDE